jgi:hypothetical protein
VRRDVLVVRDPLAKEAHLVHAPRPLHEERAGGHVVAPREERLVVAIEDIEDPVADAEGGVKDLLHLPRHHREELLGGDELEVDRRLADALAARRARLDDGVQLGARDDAEAVEGLPEALVGHVRTGPHHRPGVEEDRALRLAVEHDDLSRP